MKMKKARGLEKIGWMVKVLHQIALWGKWSLNLLKVWRNKVNSNLLETLIVFVLISFFKRISFQIWNFNGVIEILKKTKKQKKKKQKNQFQIGPIEHFAFYSCPPYSPLSPFPFIEGHHFSQLYLKRFNINYISLINVISFNFFCFKDCFQFIKHGFFILIRFFFMNGYMAQIAHLNIGFNPWFFKNSNCLQEEIQRNS